MTFIGNVIFNEQLKSLSVRLNEREGFALALETKDYSPEELSVKQMGRKLRVSGKTEKKPDDGEGSYSSRCQEFRQEFDLPDGVNPETVTCSLDHDGKLHIEVAERVVPINCSLDVKIPLIAVTCSGHGIISYSSSF
uniref:SHSP domain-containing protein n=1 Tax=Oncorhynchus mykiss TaxID=8022 RepID=A0A8C7RQL0_ONCMY